jgi:threonine dehydratase
MIPFQWLKDAVERIEPYIRRTPLTYDPEYQLYLKWENHQVTGSFKARGAFNKVLSLVEWERQQGLVTASAGNHGQGVALAGKETGAPVIVFASEHAAPLKVEAMKALGAEVRLVPGGYGEAEAAALAFAESSGATWVSPYNDGQVIAGQGTAGLEILAELPEARDYTWLVPVGGGGLLSGIGAALEAHQGQGQKAQLYGVQSEASPFMHVLFHGGSQKEVEELPSLADGLSGPVEDHSLTILMAKQTAREIILVTEEDIAHAIRFCAQRYGERIEGSAAVTLASVLSGKISQRPAVLLVSGGNIGDETYGLLSG